MSLFSDAPFSDVPLSDLPAAAGAGITGSIAWTESADAWALAGVGIVAGGPAWTESADAWALAGAGTIVTPVIVKIAPFFTTDTITTAGYQLYSYVGSAITADGAHHTSGINAIPSVTNGYQVALYSTGMTLDADGGYRGSIVWDSGGGSPFYVADEVYVPPTRGSLDLTQAIPTSNTAQTVGDALNAARAQGFGKWVLTGTSLAIYAADGTTIVKTLTLDSSTAPTQRV